MHNMHFIVIGCQWSVISGQLKNDPETETVRDHEEKEKTGSRLRFQGNGGMIYQL